MMLMIRAIMLLAAVPALSSCAGKGPAGFDVRPVVPDGYGAMSNGTSDLYALGKRQLAAGNAGLAIDAFRRALRTDPNSVDTLNGLAVAYDRIQRFDLSRRYYEQALGIDPTSAMVLHNYGYSLALQGKAVEGRELMAKAAASHDPVVTGKAKQNLARLAISPPPSPSGREDLPLQTAHRWIERTSAVVQTLVTAGDGRNANPASIEPRLRKVSFAADGAAPASPILATALPTVADAVSQMARLDEAAVVAVEEAQPISPVQVVNAVGRSRMAMRFGGYLSQRGVEVVGLRNGSGRNAYFSEIRFDQAHRGAAVAIARLLPFEVALRPASDPTAGVQLILGHNALHFDDTLKQRHREV